MSLTGEQERTIQEIIALLAKVEGVQATEVEFEPPGKPQIIVTTSVEEHSLEFTGRICKVEEQLAETYPDFDVRVMISADEKK